MCHRPESLSNSQSPTTALLVAIEAPLMTKYSSAVREATANSPGMKPVPTSIWFPATPHLTQKSLISSQLRMSGVELVLYVTPILEDNRIDKYWTKHIDNIKYHRRFQNSKSCCKMLNHILFGK